MGKLNMTTVDVAAQVACLRKRILSMWLINIFDINSKTYVLKFGTSGEGGEKVFLVLESGTRFHTTQYHRDKNEFPSPFNLKLRKHLRGRKLQDIRQLGIDRIVEFTFGKGDKATHLILELYAQGNVVLTDSKYEVLILLRSHRDDNKGYALMPRHPYPVHAIRLPEPLTQDALSKALSGAQEDRTLKDVVNSVLPYGAALSEHCLLSLGLDPFKKRQTTDAEFLSEQEALKLYQSAQEIEAWFKDIWTTPPEGFLFLGDTVTGGDGNDNKEIKKYSEFAPQLLIQQKDRAHIKCDTFDAALDEFFSKIEGQKAEVAQVQAEKQRLSRVEKTRRDQERRAQGLHRAAQSEEIQAQLIEMNLDEVDAAINAVNAVLATGMDWKEVQELIEQEKKDGNPVAGIIHALQLDQNKICLLLPTYDDEESDSDSADDSQNQKSVKIHVDLSLSAHGNACLHYDAKKKNVLKEKKTHEATEAALKSAEAKAQRKMKEKQKVVTIHELRKPFWFEKFNWFISSENFLVISGREAQQNEVLVKRYMGKDDLYVHADLHGASTTIIKNHRLGKPVPPLTLEQAGAACVCRSKAWDGKVVTSAWWVYSHQVSKTAPTGEYLTTGSFMVRGKKNYLPPVSLVFGFGFMFKLEESCIAAHKGERLIRGVEDEDQESQSWAESVQDPAEDEQTPQERTGADPDDPQDQAASTIDDGNNEEDSLMNSNSFQRSETASSHVSALDSFLDGTTDFLSSTAGSRQLSNQMDDAMSDSAKLEASGTSGSTRSSVDGSVDPAKVTGKKRISKKEREKLKKAQKAKTAGEPEPTIPETEPLTVPKKKENPTPSAELPEPSEAPSASVPLPKTKGKNKQKKMKKYADFDDEDLQLMMEFMGAGGEKKTRTEKRQERKERLRAKKAAKVLEATGQKQGEELEKEIEETIAKAKEIPFTIQEQDKEEVDVPETANGNVDVDNGEDEEGVIDVSDGVVDGDNQDNAGALEGIDRDHVASLDSLTGCPKAEDTLLFALPVCAPYDVMVNYKYKVKLTPGPMKKGKAAKHAVELFSKLNGALGNEVQLLKAVPDPEMMQVLLSMVKISMPGMSKIKEAVKKSKKKSKK